MQRESSLLSRLHDFGSDMVELSSVPEPRLARIDHHHRRRRMAAGNRHLGGRILRGSPPRPGVGVVCGPTAPAPEPSGLWIAGGGFGNTPTPGTWEAGPGKRGWPAHRGPSPARLRMSRILLSAGRRMAAPSPPAILDFLVQREGVTVEMAKAAKGEGEKGRSVSQRLKKLTEEKIGRTVPTASRAGLPLFPLLQGPSDPDRPRPVAVPENQEQKQRWPQQAPPQRAAAP